MKTVTFKITGLPEQFIAELREILKHAFGDGATLSDDGVVSVSVPEEWDEGLAISMIKSLFTKFDLRYATKATSKP